MQKRANLDKRVYDMLADWRDPKSDSWDSGFLGLISRIVPWFEAERIDYMFEDSVAVQLHGGEACGRGAFVRATPVAWNQMLTGRHDGFSVKEYSWGRIVGIGEYVSPVRLLDSLDSIRVSILGVYVASLPFLISELLTDPIALTRAVVVSLIRANGLDETFRHSLPFAQHSEYRNCLRRARRTTIQSKSS